DRKPDVKTVAIINPDYAFGHDAAKIFTAALKALKPDIQIVAENTDDHPVRQRHALQDGLAEREDHLTGGEKPPRRSLPDEI
ncbi:hypothetical protein, partial [Bradyrhizobium uaiense]